MRKVEVKDITSELQTMIEGKAEGIIYCVHELPLVFASKTNDVNYDYCNEKGLTCIESQNFGGTIVADAGDVNMAIFVKNGWDVGKRVLSDLSKFLTCKGLNCSIDGNDIMIDGKYKVISFASVNIGDRLIYTCFHISFNPNLELIQNICNKPMTKIPKGLSEFNIETDEILSEIDKVYQEIIK